MLRVLMVSDSDSKYGAPHSLAQMATTMTSLYGEDISITVALNHGAFGIKDDLERGNCRVVGCRFEPFYQAIPNSKIKLLAKYPIKGIKYLYGKAVGLKQLTSQIDVNSIDIVHANSSREDFGWQIAHHFRKPLVWHIREFGDLDYNCYSYRNNYISLMNSATSIITVSDAVRAHWEKKGVDASLMRTVYNGVPVVGAREYESHCFDRTLRVVFAGGLYYSKGQWQLIEALRLLPAELKKSVNVDIIGDGNPPYVRRIKRMVEEYGLCDQVHFLGYLNNPNEQFSNYDLGCVCSRCEGFGRVTAEYMMAGLAVIASNSGANPELIRDGVDGLLYENGDIEGLSHLLERLINNREMVAEMGASGRNRALGMFSVETNARSVKKVYDLAVARR